MKHTLLIIVLLLLCTDASAQLSTKNAWRLRSGSSVPSGACVVGPPFTDVYIYTVDHSIYQCTAASTWTKVVDGGTPVSGSGASGRLALWSSTSVLTSDPGLTFSGAALTTTSTMTAAAFAGTTRVGISNFNQAAQSQIVVSATEYYITNSNLNMPSGTPYTTPIAAGTTMRWRIALTKTAAGTGTFQILLKKGTNGTTADTSIVTQTIGTQTAVADNMECDITLTWTSATGAYWSIIPRQSAGSGTGFGLVYPATAAQFSGTIAGQTTTTASDKYGLSMIFTTGTPTFVVNMVQAQAFGVN